MRFQKPISFDQKYGEKVAKFGYTQVPHVLIHNLPKFGLEPVDLVVIEYIWSRGSDKYTAVSLMTEATGKHPNTVRKSLRKLVRLGYLKKIFAKGDANKYDLTGLVKSIRVYTETGITPVHNPYTGVNKNSAKKKQKLGTNKDSKKKEIERMKRHAFPDKRNRL